MKKCLFISALALFFELTAVAQTDTMVSKIPANKNAVLEEFTGVNCQYCPDGHRIAAQIANNNPDRVFVINIHEGEYASRYKTQFGSAIANQFGSHGWPSGVVNRHTFPVSDGSTTTMLDRGSFAQACNIIMNEPSPVNIKAWGTLDYSDRTLDLTVQLYYTASSNTSTNMLNVAILQDNVLGPQINGSVYNPDQMVGSYYNHQHMLRHLITGQWGTTITTTTAGSFVEKHYTYQIPESFGVSGDMVEAVLENLKFIVFVAEGHKEILTATQATITGWNMPPVMLNLKSISERPVTSCGNLASAYLLVENQGSDALQTMKIKYKVGGGSYQTYVWHGNIASGTQDTVHLPEFAINTNVNQTVYASITEANGESVSTFELNTTIQKLAYTCGGWMMLDIKTDQYGSENSFKLFGPNGNVILSGGPFNNASVSHTFEFTPQTVGCYILEVYDEYGDGMNNGYGAGYVKLFDADGNLVFNNNGKIGAMTRFYLNVTSPVGVEEHVLSSGEVKVFPNPASNVLNFDSEESISHVEMFNMQGQMVKCESGDIRAMNIEDANNGIYLLKITTPNGVYTQKVVKQ